VHLQKALSAHLQAGSVVYDVGAHIGVVSMFASELVGSTGAVFAFEADPENAKRIEDHVRRNSLGQIQVFSCAVWSSPGQLSFERASAQSSRNQGSVVATSGQAKPDVIVVQSISLDNFAHEHLPPTLIKIDVEGAEAEVLRGCEQIFSRSHPVLICEVHHREAEEQVCPWLSQRGYSLEWLAGTAEYPRQLLAMPTSDPFLDSRATASSAPDAVGWVQISGLRQRGKPTYLASPRCILAGRGHFGTKTTRVDVPQRPCEAAFLIEADSRSPDRLILDGCCTLLKLRAGILCMKAKRRTGMSNAKVIALLGRRDEPSDAVEEYCQYLAGALSGHGCGWK